MNQISSTILKSQLSTDIWEDFFSNGFDNGDAIYSYVLHGENPSVISTIEPMGIMNLCDKRGLLLGKVLKKYISGYETASANLHFICSLFLNKYPEHKSNFLRALDIFNKLCGDIPLHENLFNLITNEKLITIEDFSKRYDQCKKNSFTSLLSMKLDYCICNPSPNGQVLQRIYHLMSIHREKLIEGFEDFFSVSYHNISLAFFFVYSDELHNVNDILTEKFRKFAHTHWQAAFLNALKTSSTLSSDDLLSLAEFLESKSDDTLQYFTQLLKSKLDTFTDKKDFQPDYTVLDRLDESLSVLIPSMYLSIDMASFGSHEGILRAFELLISIYPVKTLELISNFIDRNYDSPINSERELHRLHINLSSLGIKPHHEAAYRLLYSEDEIYKQDHHSIARALTLIPEYRAASLIEKVIRI